MEKGSKRNLAENLVPVLLLASVALSFLVGILWQRVSGLEQGTSGTKVAGAVADTGQQPPTEVKLSNLDTFAEAAGVDKNKFKACVDSKKYADKVESDFKGGVDAGVSGTPGNFIVNTKNEVWFIPGAFPYESVKQVADMALGKAQEEDLSQKGIEKLTADKADKLIAVRKDDHVRGSSNPQVYLIEYSDYECPFCVRFHPTAQKLIDDYKEAAWVYRHYPLDQLHPNARRAAEASECVTELGGNDAFWKFTDEIYKS